MEKSERDKRALSNQELMRRAGERAKRYKTRIGSDEIVRIIREEREKRTTRILNAVYGRSLSSVDTDTADPMPLPSPPASIHADFSAMNAKQLRLAQEEIWEWISSAESAPYDDSPEDDVLDMAREALNEVIAERRSLHGDETAPRGG